MSQPPTEVAQAATPTTPAVPSDERRGWFDEDHVNKRSVTRAVVVALMGLGLVYMAVFGWLAWPSLYKAASRLLEIGVMVLTAGKAGSFGVRWAQRPRPYVPPGDPSAAGMAATPAAPSKPAS